MQENTCKLGKFVCKMLQIVIICAYSLYLSSYTFACLLAQQVQLYLCGWLC